MAIQAISQLATSAVDGASWLVQSPLFQTAAVAVAAPVAFLGLRWLYKDFQSWRQDCKTALKRTAYTQHPLWVAHRLSAGISPTFSRYRNLKTLSLPLASLPQGSVIDLSKNPQLEVLHLCKCRLVEVPDFTGNNALQDVNLSGNAFETFPDFSKPSLRKLDISYNYLSQLPNLSNNPALGELNISYNVITQLPDSLLTLPSNCVVYAWGNMLTDEYIAIFLQRLREHQQANPSQGPDIWFYRRMLFPAA